MFNRSVIVTGGAVGIGSAVVKRLASEGYGIVFTYHTHKVEASALVDELTESGADIYGEYCDISVPDDCSRIADICVEHFGSVTALVNNAGVAQQKLFTDITDCDWERMISNDLTGAFNMSRAVLSSMIHNKYGAIVNIASMWGETGASCEVHYSAAKAGVIGMTKALAKEVAPSGIRVNCVSPGCVDTAMMAGFSADDIAALCEEIPLGRIARADEIASAVGFLLSDDASYITGQVLGVNGGMVI